MHFLASVTRRWLDHASVSLMSTSAAVTSLSGATFTTLPHVFEYAAAGKPSGIVGGPDGNVWFTEETGDAIGRLSTSGTNYTAYVCAACALPTSIVVGGDGSLWFGDFTTDRIYRITIAGSISTFGYLGNHVSEVTFGPGRNVSMSLRPVLLRLPIRLAG